jgi:hypothetical protein
MIDQPLSQRIKARSGQGGLFCKMNVEHRTSNVQHRIKKQTSNTEHSTTPRRGFFSAVLILVTKILINSSVSSFSIQSRLGVIGRSMFDVHFFQSLLRKNNLALMGQGDFLFYF